VLIGSVLNVGTVSANHIIRSEGLAKISMISMIMGAIINILLDPIFIYTLDFGIKGAAWATVIAQFCSLAFIMLYFQFGKAQVEIAFKHFKPTKAIYYEVLKIGIPVLFYHLLQNVSMGIINNQASLYGDYAVAAIGIVTRILPLLSYVVFGFSKGYQPIAGYCYGSKMYDRLNKATNFTLKVLTGYCILSAGIVLIFGYPLLGLFSQSPTVLVIAYKALVLWLITYIFLGYQMTYITLFMSIGKARESALLGLCRQGLCLIPLLLILPHFFHLNGILFAQATADICALTLTIYFKRKSYIKGHLGVI
ncbi:MAG: polysaccharide biosynthesis C-terminal domain-containing protein, partial [Clostridia bacterium]|nr:polysaccharide biosynthesis C-terminal domain-containing protein [Clostridia bacterium]